MEEYWLKIFESDLYINEMLKIWEEGEKWANWINEVIKKYGIKGKRILDVPCGIGRVSYFLSKLGYSITGVDISEKMIKKAKENVKEGEFVRGDMRKLSEVIKEKYDVVINIFNSLGYYEEEDDLKILRELREVTSQEGIVVVNLENRDFVIYNKPEILHSFVPPYLIIDQNKFDPFTSRLHVLRTYIKDGKEVEKIEFSQRYYSLHEIVSLMKKAGFKIIDVFSGYSWEKFEINDPQMTILAKPS
ncbi:bifunctional 2-polyprenyl-6-hydroxyphenol methylase/3-demethylubiquinol 3-O-methyltransferase UbiG [Sulfurisphaera ohwakuensis]|uniref:Methyltransferase domain-containing protein n=1 Tax=Sulfurisphaera ohwakuensis TaxID=69656 RepID=A0A650CIW0_SULOH|nr:class I SAM-dependent methyltransferase [Sulfurisphaera ohwakuensis]MBB5253495.1 ubiquinone/menaquinone biosynthesis C-methylase UbiE [Sulfurisphaera ohwakuensis]QGR17801.1 methyltransferase domain-containing protein [Sulfurisphaera ohwakuensis]